MEDEAVQANMILKPPWINTQNDVLWIIMVEYSPSPSKLFYEQKQIYRNLHQELSHNLIYTQRTLLIH